MKPWRIITSFFPFLTLHFSLVHLSTTRSKLLRTTICPRTTTKHSYFDIIAMPPQQLLHSYARPLQGSNFQRMLWGVLLLGQMLSVEVLTSQSRRHFDRTVVHLNPKENFSAFPSDSACLPMHVHQDATYCLRKNDFIQDPKANPNANANANANANSVTACQGMNPRSPAGHACPKKGDVSVSDCRRYLASYVPARHRCEAPMDAQCIWLDFQQSWACQFVSPVKLNHPSLPFPREKPSHHKLKIVSYNDVYILEQLDGLGGASRFAQYVADLRLHHPHMLVLFSGDTMSPSLWSRMFRGMQMIQAHNIIGLDYASLGNHEFDMGLDVFYNASRASNFPWLNANCFDIASNRLLRYTQPNALAIVNGIQVGLFGVMYDMQDNTTGAYWSDPIQAAREQVRYLRMKGAQVIIALTHQDWEDDNKMALEVDGIDLMVGGHDHKAMMQTNFGTSYVKADSDFRNAWNIDLEYFPSKLSTSKVIMQMKNAPMTKDRRTHPHMDSAIEALREKVDKNYGEIIGKSCVDLDASHSIVRMKECALGNLISDAVRASYYPRLVADTAIVNGGNIRSDAVYPAGKNLTLGDIININPFGNYIVVIQITGRTFQSFLSLALQDSCAEDGMLRTNPSVVHPSGFQYVFKCTSQRKGHFERLRWFEQREDQAMKEDDVFTVALNSYIYEMHQNLFEASPSFQRIVDEREAFDDALVVRNAFQRVKIVCPQIQNRFALLDSSTSSSIIKGMNVSSNPNSHYV